VTAQTQSDHADLFAARRLQVADAGVDILEHGSPRHHLKKFKASFPAGGVTRELCAGRGPVMEVRGERNEPEAGQSVADVTYGGVDTEQLHGHHNPGKRTRNRWAGEVGAHRLPVAHLDADSFRIDGEFPDRSRGRTLVVRPLHGVRRGHSAAFQTGASFAHGAKLAGP
jgi:hypothetical protein